MHADLVIAVLQPLERQRVVEILGIGGVYREGEGVTEILAPLEVFGSDGFGNLVRGVLHLFIEAVRQVELGKDGVHLGVVVARRAEHVHYVAQGARLAPLPAVHYGRHLHPGLRSQAPRLLRVHLDVVGHKLALHQHPGLGADVVHISNERSLAVLENLDHLSFAPLPAASGTGHRHPHQVAVEGVAGLGGLDVDIIVLAVHNHEDVALAGHLYLSYKMRDLPSRRPGMRLLPRLIAFLASSFHILSSVAQEDFHSFAVRLKFY